MPEIHETALIGERVTLGEGVRVGPHALIEDDVTIGPGTSIGAFSVICSQTALGKDCVIDHHVKVGGDPQILGWERVPSRTVIGDRCVFREFSSVHRAKDAEGATVVGDDCLFMVTSHAGHDCQIGRGVVVVNGALLGGHVEVGDRAFISGNVAIHQFCRIGRLAMVQGLAGISKDVPPFCTVDLKNNLSGLNLVGLRRAGVATAHIQALKSAVHTLFRTPTPLVEATEAMARQPDLCAEVRELLAFIREAKRGVCSVRRVKEG